MKLSYIVSGGLVLFLIVAAMAQLQSMKAVANDNILQYNNNLRGDSDNNKNYGNVQDRASLAANYGMNLEMTKWLGPVQMVGFIGAFISGGILVYGIFSRNNNSRELVGEKVSYSDSRHDPYLQERKIREWNNERFSHHEG